MGVEHLSILLLLPVLFTAICAQGPLQEICLLQADVTFVVDSSGSINDRDPGNWNRVRNFMTQIVDQLQVGRDATRVGVVKYSNLGEVEFNLDTYTSNDEVKNAINRMSYLGGNTNTSGGLYYMLKELYNGANGDRDGVEDLCIVITDGVSTRDPRLTAPYAAEAHSRGIKVIAVGIGDQVNMEELFSIASQPKNDSVFTVTDFSVLSGILDNLITETCVTPPSTPRPTTTTTAAPPAPGCREPVDFIMIFDASGSVQHTNFNKMKNFARNLVTDLDVENGAVRVGMMTFADNAVIRFHLNRFDNRKDILAEIDKIPYSHGTTNTADALGKLHGEMYTSGNGDRTNARNVALLVTDGSSNDGKRTLAAAREAKGKGVHIFVAAIGSWLNMQEMNGMATHPYERNRFALNNFDSLNNEFKRTIRELSCNANDECASNPCRNAVRCSDSLGYFHCTCSEGFAGITCSDRCRDPSDLVFAIDSSGSIGKENFEKMVDFVRDIIDGVRIGTSDSSRPGHVGLETYSNRANVVFNLKDYNNKFDILNAFPPFYDGGATRTDDALKTMRESMFTAENGDQPQTRNIGIVITDGRSNEERKTWEEALKTRNAGIELISIGVGGQTRVSELQGIASEPNEENRNMMRTDNFANLDNLKTQLINTICNNQNECESGPCRNGGICEDRLNGYHCRCPDEYTGQNCERRCSGVADVVFAIDKSGSIRRERFEKVLDFVKGIILQLDVGTDRTRVGVVSWSDDGLVDFDLKRYTSKQDVLQATSYVKYLGGRTHTAKAIELMRTDIFTPAGGDRENVPNFAFIITDGNSNINQGQTIKEAIQTRLQGVHVFTVSVGKDLNMLELKGMASQNPSSNMFTVERFDQLPELINQMPSAMCNDVNECESNPCQSGGRCVDGLKRYTCLCPEGRTGDNCQFSCRRQMDITFILDMSGSTEELHERTINFARRVVGNLDMSFGRTRVGLITYGDDSTLQFALDAYSQKEEVMNAMTFLPNKGRTNTQASLRMMRSEVFSTSRGDRPGVENIAVLVTDGYSNINPENTIPAAREAKSQGVAVYVVAIGQEVDMGEVNSVAGKGSEPPDRYVFRIQNSGEIPAVADTLGQRLCQWQVES